MSNVKTRVMFFCLGNICRSPLGEGLFVHKVSQRGLTDAFHIESSGTSAYHVGEPPDMGSQRVARDRGGFDISGQRSQQLTRRHVEEFDVVVAMDRSNQRAAERLSEGQSILLLRDYDPSEGDRGTDVPDPWGGGPKGFEAVYDIVDRCCDVLLDSILAGEF
jgi:protein-tyrosine phosphatase